MLPYAAICCHVPPYAAICCHMLPYAATCCQTLPDAARRYHMLLYAAICCDVTGRYKMLQDVTRRYSAGCEGVPDPPPHTPPPTWMFLVGANAQRLGRGGPPRETDTLNRNVTGRGKRPTPRQRRTPTRNLYLEPKSISGHRRWVALERALKLKRVRISHKGSKRTLNPKRE